VDLSILFELAKTPLHFNELARRMKGKCSRRTLQKRLNELVKTGMLKVKMDGQYKFYTIVDKSLRTGLKLLNQLSNTAKVILSSNISDHTLRNEIILLSILTDLVWYYVWFNFMVRREIGEILLSALTEEYWPKIFKLLKNFLNNKGVDLEKALNMYLSKLLIWIEKTKGRVVIHRDLVHKNEICEIMTCLLEAYKSLTPTEKDNYVRN